ncbi:MAG: phosphate ABC transporter permease subunit PstC [Candidatus Hadarchaeia archaeon]
MKDLKERLIEGFLGLNAVSIVLILLAIFIFIGITGIEFFLTPEVSLADFFLSLEWNPMAFGEPEWGVINLILGTLFIAIGALGFSVPLGIATAIYLSELADSKTRNVLKPVFEMIAAIPSVVLGLFGLLVFAPFLAQVFGLPNGLNAFTASILVGFLALPTIISISEDAISGVPESYKKASYALGATKLETIQNVSIPAAKSGIIASVMLGFGRIVGETMVVSMVAGNVKGFPTNLFDAVRPMTANIAIEAEEIVQGSVHYKGLFAIGVLLFLITFGINTVADWIIHRGVQG